MSENILHVESREVSGKSGARALRRAGRVPGILYGGAAPVPVSLSLKEIVREIDADRFLSRVVEIDHDGKKENVVGQDLQFHPLTDRPLHVDLLRIARGDTVRVEVPVRFVGEGESPGLKRGGALNVVRRAVEIDALPTAIPEELVCDLTGLDIGDNIKMSAIDLPANAKLTITDRDFTIATITGRIATPVDEVEDVVDAAEDEEEEAQDETHD